MNETPPPKMAAQRRKKTPTILQMESVECGAAALCMILEYHGRVVPLEEMRVACGVSRDGVKASNMVKAARKYGFQARGLRREPADLADVEVPMIVHWNFNHFLVLEGVKGAKVYLNDPASGPRTVTKEEFDQAFTGVALEFNVGSGFRSGGRRRSTLASLRSRFRDPLSLLFVVLAGLMLVLPGLVTPIFSKVFVDQILVKGMESWFRPLLLGLIIAALVKGALTWLQQYYLLRFEAKLALSESGKYLQRLLQLPVVFFSQRMAGDLAKRVSGGDRVAQLLTKKLATALLNIMTVLFFMVLMFIFDWQLTLMGLLIVLVNLAVLAAANRIREEQSMRFMVEANKLYGTAATGLMLVETLKATGSESDFFAKWSGYHAKYLNTAQKMGRVNTLTGVFPPFLSQLTAMTILIFGALKIMDGEMTVGMLVAFQSLMGSFVVPFNQLVGLGGEFQEARGLMNQLDDVYYYPTDPVLRREATSDAANEAGSYKLAGGLEIQSISFGYSPLDPPLIEDFSLNVKPGARVALVGRSGSGKSTVARLIAGVLEPWSGHILFDGRMRSTYARHTIVSSLAVIDQNISLFEGTIRENLTLWDVTIPERQYIQAAKDAHIHDEITHRAGGYESLVEEGGRNFSGGQRQRLEIARGLVLNPSILVLDEATSALDPQTEHIIDSNLRRRGATCLIVAHRLSTIRDCDEIIVMDHGKIIQRGTHEVLLEKEGLYAGLIKSM